MVDIRYFNRKGDQVQQLALQDGQELVAKEMEAGNIVYDETEARLVEKATMGQIKADSKLTIYPPAGGG